MMPSMTGGGFQSQLLNAIYNTEGPGGIGLGPWKTMDTGYGDLPQGQLNAMLAQPTHPGGPTPSQMDDIQKEQTRRASNLLQDKWSYGMGDGFGNQRLARATRIFGHGQSEINNALGDAGIQPW